MNKRKQNLEIKPEVLFSGEKDSLMDYDMTSDLFSSSISSDLDIPSNVIYDDFLHFLDLPLSFEDEPLLQENKEVFQDLCCTSTPKSFKPSVSKVFCDSGIEESVLKKHCKENVSSYVLEEITNKIDSVSNVDFQNIQPNSSVDSVDVSFKKHVNILRKDIVLQQKSKIVKTDSSDITKEQMIYYTGIKSYDCAVAILKHIKMPKEKISGFKMQLMALMKLRLDLPWLDMAFRFSISETLLKEIVRKAFDIMSYSMEEMLPWHSQRKASRRTVLRFYYVYSLISGDSSHILIILTDSKRPILFVSEKFDSEILPVSIVLSSCSKHLIPGDTLCITETNGMNAFYTVSSSPDLAFFLPSPSANHYSAVKKCNIFISQLLSEFILLTKDTSSFNVCNLVKVACAIVNVNVISEINSFQLQKVFERSSSMLLQNQ